MDATVPYIVYLPAGYTTSQKYPVWYAMHGSSSTENFWLDFGKAGERADALTASGELAPMIMVFPFTRYDDAKTIVADMEDGVRGPSRMERFLCEELIPYIDAHYNTIASAEGRCIGGFSMGGLFALQIGLHQPQLFSRIGAYSPALTYSDFSGDHFERWLSTDPADANKLDGYAKTHGMDMLSIYLDCGGASDPFSAGAEVVAADLGDPGSVRRAFEGAWVIRLISRSWMRIYYFTAGSEQYLSGHKTNHLRCVVIYESGRKRKRKIAEQVAPFYFYNNVT